MKVAPRSFHGAGASFGPQISRTEAPHALSAAATAHLTPAFHAANAYLDWGEPEGGAWFVGLEEADSWIDLPMDEVARRYLELGEVSPATSQRDFESLGATSQLGCSGRGQSWGSGHLGLLLKLTASSGIPAAA